MARIPHDELERLKSSVSIVRLAEARGIELKPHGDGNLIGLCPWHDDRSPSLIITPSKNLWHCMGACNEGGDVFSWVVKDQGVSFRHAVELLRTEANLLRTRYAKTSTVRKLPPPVELDADDRSALSQVVGFYHEAFLQSPEASAYMESRGLACAEDLAKRFSLGFGNRTLGYRLPLRNRKEGSAIRGKLEKLGILRPSGHELFTGCITFPVFDEEGDVTEIYGRKIGKALRPGTPLHLYLPGPHRGIWNADGLKESQEVILCEALIDALTFWCAGFHNVTASYGTSGFTDAHLAAFKKHGTKRVLIAYDRDDAGDVAAEKLGKRLTAEGIEAFRIHFPHGMDANDYACKVTPAAKSLGVVIRVATWMGNGKAPSQAALPIAREALTAPAAKEENLAASTAAPPDPPPSPSPPLAASAPPATPAPRIEAPPSLHAELEDGVIKIPIGDRLYRVIGLASNLTMGQMRVNLLARRGDAFHVDTLDLYAARFRSTFIKQAAEEMQLKEDVIKRDLGRVLLKLEELQEQEIRKATAPKDATPTMTEEERREALAFLVDRKLLDRILKDFEQSGVVGEETNKLVGYLAAVSRKLERPLAVLMQSSSAAGKTMLMESVLSFMPEEDRVKYSAMTGQSLFYMGERDLRHRILAIVEEEGASRASYALKLLQSEGELSIASTGKDPQSGKLITHEYQVKGPVMIFLTTTAVEIDDELLNRCIVLTVDEDREQTRAIHRMQREQETLEGLLSQRRRERRLKLHRNAQRLLKPVLVRNPYARELTFLDTKTRTRRDHTKYLALIRCIALLHQHQRPRRTVVDEETGEEIEYIDVELSDIEIANRLAHRVLGRSLSELSATTESLLLAIEEMVTAVCQKEQIDRQDYRFSRRDIREHTGWSDFQVRTHLAKLVELEYVLVHRGGRGQSFVYELLYDGQGKDREPFVVGLIDAEQLRKGARASSTTQNIEHPKGGFEHQKGRFEGGSSPQRAPIEPPSSIPLTAVNPTSEAAPSDSAQDLVENAHRGGGSKTQSYPYSHAGSGRRARPTRGAN